MATFEAHAAHLFVAGNSSQLPLGRDDGVPLSEVTALSNEVIPGHIRDPVEDAVGDGVKRSEKFFRIVNVLVQLLLQQQLCDCRAHSVRNFSGVHISSQVQVIFDGMDGSNELFFCSVCENDYFRRLLGKDVREDCETLLGFLESDNDYEFRCTVLDIITFLIRLIPTTIPIFMEGYFVADDYILNEGRAMKALNTSLLEQCFSRSATRYGREHRLRTIRDNIRVAAPFMMTMTDLNDISSEEYVTRAESLLDMTQKNDYCGSFAAYVLVGFMHHAAAAAYDFVGNAVFDSLSQEIVIKWWDYAFDQSADSQQSNGHLRLLRLIYSWYVSGFGHFMFQQGTLAWKILWVPMIMQIGKSRDMEKLGPFLKMAVVSWQSNNLAEFVALHAGVREDLRSLWPSITCERNLASSHNEYLHWTLKVILRALVSGKHFATAFRGRDDIQSHIDRLDKVEAFTQTCVTVCSRGEVLLSEDPLYYLISPPVLLNRMGTVKAVEISCKCLEYIYMANGRKRRRDITGRDKRRSSPVLMLHFVIVREDGSIEFEEHGIPTKQNDESLLTWTINDGVIISQFKPSDKVGVWARTRPLTDSECSRDGTSRQKQRLIKSESKLHLQSMTINIRF